ncbi:MAG: CBS domain-containing protein [Bdellovibrionota bacterium]
MTVRDICQFKTVTVEAGETVLEAAKKMKHEHVGDVVVVSPKTRKPIGILTDRDIVNFIVSENILASNLNVEDVMMHELCVLSETDGIYKTASTMKKYGIRRIPIVDENGELIGICAMDDILRLLAKEMTFLANVPRAQIATEKSGKIRTIS